MRRYGRVLISRVRIDPHNPQAKADLFAQLVALCQISRLPTVAARRRAYRRIPKGWARSCRREMAGLIADIRQFFRGDPASPGAGRGRDGS